MSLSSPHIQRHFFGWISSSLYSRVLLFVACASFVSFPAISQHIPYGSADNPAEHLPQPWWRSEAQLDVRAGTSIIGPHWRAATSLRFGVTAAPFSANLQGTVRAGIYGMYQEDFNEWYDLVRLIEFARYNPGLASPVFARIGPIRHMRLGHGHLVDLLHSDVAWDDRTVGAEISARAPFGHISVFTDDVRLDGLTAGRVSATPFSMVPHPMLQSVEVGAEAATDLGVYRADHLEDHTAFSVDSRMTVLTIGGLMFVPYAGYSSFLQHGSGWHTGVSFEADNLMDLARFHLKFAYHRNDDAFLPGHFGTFYQVNNPRARLLDAGAYFANEGVALQPEQRDSDIIGVPLEDIQQGNNLEGELRVLLFNQMEIRSRFRRHYGADPLSIYNLRFFFRATDQLHVDIGFARSGLTNFFSLFRALEDQTALTFKAGYQLFPGAWVFADAAYTYESIAEMEDGTRLYVTQRRFEPMGGFRFTF